MRNNLNDSIFTKGRGEEPYGGGLIYTNEFKLLILLKIEKKILISKIKITEIY